MPEVPNHTLKGCMHLKIEHILWTNSYMMIIISTAKSLNKKSINRVNVP
jgi:hypothetical protein